jgi:hypothetical protein
MQKNEEEIKLDDGKNLLHYNANKSMEALNANQEKHVKEQR